MRNILLAATAAIIAASLAACDSQGPVEQAAAKRDVATAGGVVTLNGTVEFPAEKDRAALLALGVDGVRSVVNNLVVIRGS